MEGKKNTIVMGVSGCGKSTLAARLAAAWNVRYVDADDVHSEANKAKMRAGIPLSDEDRAPWLEALAKLLEDADRKGSPIVLACSALKVRYRDVLRRASKVVFLYLKVDRGEIEERLRRRSGHFMNPTLVDSQFRALEEPTAAETDAFVISREDDDLSIGRLLGWG